MNGYVPLAKFLWFKEEAPEIYEKTDKILLLEVCLIFRLTGKTVSEKSLLTSTAWFNIRKDKYWHELLEKLGLDEDRLPEACECGSVAGAVTKDIAALLGLSEDVKVVAGAKGVFFGLDIGSSREVLVRATLEGIGNMIRENLDMLRGLGADIKTVQFFGGGSKNAVWNQIIADISDVTLVKSAEEECGSLGCAILAACALGERDSVESAQDCNPAVTTVVPDESKKAVYDEAYGRYQKLFDAVQSLY